jgi:hypothetical protein
LTLSFFIKITAVLILEEKWPQISPGGQTGVRSHSVLLWTFLKKLRVSVAELSPIVRNTRFYMF